MSLVDTTASHATDLPASMLEEIDLLTTFCELTGHHVRSGAKFGPFHRVSLR